MAYSPGQHGVAGESAGQMAASPASRRYFHLRPHNQSSERR